MSARPPFVHSSTSYADRHSHAQPPAPAATAGGSGSSSASSNSSSKISAPVYHLGAMAPHDDDEYPPEKTETDASPEESYASRPYEPFRFSSRRSIALETQNHSRRGSWKDRVLAKNEECKGGRLGKALIIGWVVTTLMFVVATAFYKGELFSALDRLAGDLREMGYMGRFIFGFLIFITTIPPLPLYSTLMVLSGYTFGAWEGFVISYLSSLIGAVVVFVIARTFLRDCITKCLSSSPTSMSLLQIIPAKPHLLLLIRIAPYPYNLLNVILASSPSLTLRTYTGCTAVSLLKVVLHTWFGSGIHDISELHRAPPSTGQDGIHSGENGKHHGAIGYHTHVSGDHGMDPHRDDVKFYWTWGGLGLCVVLFVYLHHVAKKALARAQAEMEWEEMAEGGESTTGLVEVSRGL